MSKKIVFSLFCALASLMPMRGSFASPAITAAPSPKGLAALCTAYGGEVRVVRAPEGSVVLCLCSDGKQADEGLIVTQIPIQDLDNPEIIQSYVDVLDYTCWGKPKPGLVAQALQDLSQQR